MLREFIKCLKIFLISIITFDFIKRFLNELDNIFRHSPEQRRHFWTSVRWGVFIAVMLYFAPCTGVGQQMLNYTYDFLVERDFQSAVVDAGDKTPISDAICLIGFDEDVYVKSPGMDFWTPRDVLGRMIIKSLKHGAKVVVADIALDKPVPLADENREFLEFLKDAADIARKKGAVIILPRMSVKGRLRKYTRDFYALSDKNSDVIKLGTPVVFRNPLDCRVRHLRFYKKETDGKGNTRVIFSLPVLTAVYQWHGPEKGDKILAEAAVRITESPDLRDPVPVDSDRKACYIYLYQQEKDEECLGARYKFRIVPWEVMKPYERGKDLLSEIMLTPDDIDMYPDELQGKTVLIGSVYAETGDTHITPVGKMPGLLVLANGVNLLLMGEQIHDLPNTQKYLTEALVILTAAIIFLYLPYWGVPVVLVLFIAVFTPMSVWLFTESGMFLDFWMPVIGVGLDKIIGWVRAQLRGFNPFSYMQGVRGNYKDCT